jgi:pyruvate,orthophosphate dikinase
LTTKKAPRRKAAKRRAASVAPRYVYFFGAGRADGNAKLKDLLGGKGANLAEMVRLGLPVPAGFTLPTNLCAFYYDHRHSYPPELKPAVVAALARVEKLMSAQFGSPVNPLLVSVRSGARASMPGMMDTVLNLGLTDITVKGLIAQTKDERFAYDCYRRFVQMYGDVVLGLKPQSKDDHDPFEAILEEVKHKRGIEQDRDLSPSDLRRLVALYKDVIFRRTGKAFPEDPHAQLWAAIGAVFRSWNNPRAIAYRRLNQIPDEWGTAVNVQAMVFGNLGNDSGTGVAFTRNPATGEKKFYGEYLMNAQGEDVVAGIRTPQQIEQLAHEMPGPYRELLRIQRTLERHYRDMQDIEFTIQRGKLWMLQCRTGKRTGRAAVRMAVDMVREGLIKRDEALMRVEAQHLDQFLRPVFRPEDKNRATAAGLRLASGLPAGPGAASGRIVFNAEDAGAWAARGESVVLTRIETSPEDIRGMNAAVGILTQRGGMTSHAALVARQMGKVCVVGCGALGIDYKSRTLGVNGRSLKEGDWISLDGTTGEVIEGKIEAQASEVVQVIVEKKVRPQDSREFKLYDRVMKWADEVRRLRVRANADLPGQAQQAVAFGAEGIGLCRTEHMFFERSRITAVREMILAEDPEGRKRALAKLLPVQRNDFMGIFRAMGTRPVTIRLLDPPLHEFLPSTEADIQEVAQSLGVPAERVREHNAHLHEANPMLGHRGCRLGITYPEIYEMQVRAILEAASELRRARLPVNPEIMIPLVGHVRELRAVKHMIKRVATEVSKETGVRVPFLVGTMIELPRAAITAGEIAEEAEFFSFGTNDLTQTTFGLSRDDSATFLPFYLDHKILDEDPFVAIDQAGVGALIALAVERGRATRKGIKVGICGEHGGEPSSVAFCDRMGLDYVSCSPFRVPIARLAAARAIIHRKEEKS